MNADRCPSRIAHESGVVLGCRDVPGHVGEHWTPVAHWTDGDDRELLESAGADDAPRDARALGVRDCIEHYGEEVLPTTAVTTQADGLLRHATGGVIQSSAVDLDPPPWVSGCAGLGHVLPAHLGDREPTADEAALLAKLAELGKGGR